jgi:predicted PurR-regulated permease PerM
MRKTILFILLGIIIFIFLAWYFSNIFFYVVISGILATILRPLVDYINKAQIYRIHVPRVFAVLISFATFILIVFLFISIFIPLINEQIGILSSLNYENIISKISIPVHDLEEFLIRNNLYDQPEGLFTVAGSVSIGILAVIFITFFFLYEKGIFRKIVLQLVPNSYFEMVITTFAKIEKLLSNYLIGLLVQMTAIFTLATIGLSIVGIKYAASIALFAAVANLIPYLGPLLGAAFGIVISLSVSNFASLNEMLFLIFKIVTVFAIVQINDNLVFQPLIFSKSVKAHPLEIFIIIFVGGTLGGIIGMIAAIPVYTIVRVSVIEFSSGFKQYQIFKN